MSDTEKNFWDESWEKIDQERLRQYIAGFDNSSDAIIRELKAYGVLTVCDAGCGCGIYSLKMAANGFRVSGFDISAHAAKIAQDLLQQAAFSGVFKAANICATDYPDSQFDAVVSRDVLDHVTKKDAVQAIGELYRITRQGGILIFTLDAPDWEYETQPHIVSNDGDYLFTDGKWKGMAFRPYSESEIRAMLPADAEILLESNGEMIVKVKKR